VWPLVIRPALRDRIGRALFIGTPKGRNNFYELWERAEQDSEWARFVLRASETGILDADELDAARRDMTPEQYAQEYECSFDAAILGAYYGREIATLERAGRIADVPCDPALPVHTAWDLGIGDATAIWFFQVVGPELHVIDHYEAHGHGLSHYAAILQAKPYKYGKHYVPHDASARDLGTGRTRVETLRDLMGAYPIVLRPNDVMDGINALRVSMPLSRWDASRCREGLEALRQYRSEYDEKLKTFKDRPRHDWTSHTADAARYMATAWREMKPPKPAPTPKFEFIGLPDGSMKSGLTFAEIIKRKSRARQTED
jgi:hypothetical protein